MSFSFQANYDDGKNASSDEEDTGGATLPSAAGLVDGAMFSTSKNTTSKKNGPSVQGKKLVNKIHNILAEPSYSSIISWNDAGNAFIIYDVDAFVSTVMPMHFQNSKFDSFIRRMRRWGFRVKNKKPRQSSFESRLSDAMEFSSEYFIRDRPDLWPMMKDERMNTKQFEFLDHVTTKTSGVVESDLKRFAEVMPSLESNLPLPVHYPRQPSASLLTSQQPNYQQMMPSFENSLSPVHYPQSSNLKPQEQPEYLLKMPPLERTQHYPQAHSNLNTPQEQEYLQQMSSFERNQPLPMNYPPMSSNLMTPQQTEHKQMLPFLETNLHTPVHYPPSSSSLKPPQQTESQQSEMLPNTRLTKSTDSVGTTTNLHSFQPTIPPTMPPPYPYSYGVTPLRVPGFKTSQDRGHQKIMSIMDARASSRNANVTLLSSSSEELLPSPTNKAKQREDGSPPSNSTSNV